MIELEEGMVVKLISKEEYYDIELSDDTEVMVSDMFSQEFTLKEASGKFYSKFRTIYDTSWTIKPYMVKEVISRKGEGGTITRVVIPTDEPKSKQVGGDHYTKGNIQPIEYIQANELPFEEGSIVKYVTRHKNKNGAEDIKKIIHYCEFILERDYSE